MQILKKAERRGVEAQKGRCEAQHFAAARESQRKFNYCCSMDMTMFSTLSGSS